MLCTLVDYEGKMIQNQEKLKKTLGSPEESNTAVFASRRRLYKIQQFSVSCTAGGNEAGGLLGGIPQN